MVKPMDPFVAGFVGFAMETLLYGLYIPLFILTIKFLVYQRRSRKLPIDRLLVFLVTLLFLACTAHWIINFEQAIDNIDTFETETAPLAVRDMILSIADFLGEIILLYRCWLIWGRNYFVIILPSMTAIAGFVCGCVTINLLFATALGLHATGTNLIKLGTATYVLPLCTNVLTTTLIVGRILYLGLSVHNQFAKGNRTNATHSTGRSTLRLIYHVTEIIISSGMIYLLAQIILVVLFIQENPGASLIGYMIAPIYGIAPSLIFCRSSTESSYDTKFQSTMTGLPVFANKYQSRTLGDATSMAYDDGTTSVGANIPQKPDVTFPEHGESIELGFKTQRNHVKEG